MTSMTKEQIKSAAMELDPVERESLADELLLSLSQAEQDEIDEAWLAEARRRDAVFTATKSLAKNANDVAERLLKQASQ